MRRIISIMFAMLMLLQAIPVGHFFSGQPEVFYVYIDEEKPGEKSKEKTDSKESEFCVFDLGTMLSGIHIFHPAPPSFYSPPYLEAATQPPNA